MPNRVSTPTRSPDNPVVAAYPAFAKGLTTIELSLREP
jgi:hypothetical protein